MWSIHYQCDIISCAHIIHSVSVHGTSNIFDRRLFLFFFSLFIRSIFFIPLLNCQRKIKLIYNELWLMDDWLWLVTCLSSYFNLAYEHALMYKLLNWLWSILLYRLEAWHSFRLFLSLLHHVHAFVIARHVIICTICLLFSHSGKKNRIE